MPLLGCAPAVHASAFVAPTAVLIGPVRLGPRSGVWFQAVLRADGDEITVGEESNLQDGVVVHTDPGFPARLGSRVSVGHHAVLHGCDIQDDVLVGMHATVLNGARIGSHSIVAAGAIVPEGRDIPSHSLVAGPHGTVVRRLEEADLALISAHAQNYLALTRLYRLG
ncbi:gamma carbonic anhydrase family protein [Streptomyces qinzhouensis]|uniref:Gamma carbonic anhydrase family protein n=2 Tax=Streptomyces qinzhouensis TaxID=2599401 RepID=A0A5B8JTW6_9ACTN|nr:gamma carbonic anhydrase family protein [Streptomyces qinzhouensis]QDY81393.1 gamma carbonic anhydrase family protein [Streptomyces qinzhouensis]